MTARLVGGLVASVVLHGAFALVLPWATAPGPVPDQGARTPRLEIATHSVPEGRAPAEDPRGVRGDARSPVGPLADGGSIPTSRATSVSSTVTPLAAAAAPQAPARPVAADGTAMAAMGPSPSPVGSAPANPETTRPSASGGRPATPVRPDAVAAPVPRGAAFPAARIVEPRAVPVAAGAAEGARLTSAVPDDDAYAMAPADPRPSTPAPAPVQTATPPGGPLVTAASPDAVERVPPTRPAATAMAAVTRDTEIVRQASPSGAELQRAEAAGLPADRASPRGPSLVAALGDATDTMDAVEPATAPRTATAAPAAALHADPARAASSSGDRVGGIPSPEATSAAAAGRPNVPATPATALGGIAEDAVAPTLERAAAAGAALVHGPDGRIDPASIAALEAFLPRSSEGEVSPARDAIAFLLEGVPCARLQAEFHPDSGALELRGHVPEEALRDPVVAALQGAVGASIPVVDNVLVLPPPQCSVLPDIEALGLPQSSDQHTDPKLVGEDAHARVYRYAEGERIVLEIAAPDFDAYVRVDYFDADGNVIHLAPNEWVGSARLRAGERAVVGSDEGGFSMTVAPPFGQEIAVAFATSHEVGDVAREATEPAGQYLARLRVRLAELRARHPDFRGEWVYFFVRTEA